MFVFCHSYDYPASIFNLFKILYEGFFSSSGSPTNVAQDGTQLGCCSFCCQFQTEWKQFSSVEYEILVKILTETELKFNGVIKHFNAA